jgi:xyloglucan-specific exo-beta-1,4-glucanase
MRATALLLTLIAAIPAADVAYRETFPTGPNVDASDWRYHQTAKGHDGSKVNAWGGGPGAGSEPALNSNPGDASTAWKGFVWLPPSGDRYLLWTAECAFAAGSVETITWNMTLGDPTAEVRVALKMDGKWFASGQVFTAQDEPAKLDQAKRSLVVASTTWHLLEALPGTQLPDAPVSGTVELPKSRVEAFGFFGSKRTKTHTYDTISVITTRGPADATPVAPRPVVAGLPALTGVIEPKPLASPVLPAAGTPELGQVVIGGGGYMTGVYPSRSKAGTAFLTCDMVGPWKRTDHQGPWSLLPVTAQFDPFPGQGSSGMACHPTNGNIIYADLGGQPFFKEPMGLYKSADGGATWKLVLAKYSSSLVDSAKPLTGSRYSGPSIAIDPNQPDIVYWATRRDGVWRSGDAGATWTQAFDPQGGCRNVVVDPSSIKDGRSQRILVGVFDQGIWMSEDGGTTFQADAAFAAVAGGTKRISWLRMADDGTAYASCAGKLLKRSGGTWSSIAPEGEGTFNSVAVDPNDSRRVLALRTGQGGYSQKNAWFLRSIDGGTTWSALEARSMPRARYGGWLDEFQPMMGAVVVELDPLRPDTAWICDAFEIWQTDNAWSDAPKWTAIYQGAETTVTLTLGTPPALASATKPQAFLFSGVSDIRGFRHTDLNTMPTGRYIMADADWSTYVNGVDWCEADPSIVYAAKSYENTQEAKILRSTDNGQTWQETTNPYATQRHAGGKVSVSATEPGRVVYFPSGSKQPVVTADGGRTWKPCVLADGSPMPHVYSKCSGYNFAVAQTSDRVDGKAFYAYVNPEDTMKATPPLPPRFLVSRDGGATWNPSAVTLPSANPHDSQAPVQLLAMPGVAGELWLTLAGSGLWRSKDYGTTFTNIAEFTGSRPLGLGIGAADPRKPGSPATILVYGKRNGQQEWTLHRSTDGGVTWVTAPRTGYQNTRPMFFAADRQTFGRMYFGTGGLGIWYADTAAIR